MRWHGRAGSVPQSLCECVSVPGGVGCTGLSTGAHAVSAAITSKIALKLLSSKSWAEGLEPSYTVLETAALPTKLSAYNGAPGRIRTCDPRLRRPLLYPAELRVQ